MISENFTYDWDQDNIPDSFFIDGIDTGKQMYGIGTQIYFSKFSIKLSTGARFTLFPDSQIMYEFSSPDTLQKSNLGGNKDIVEKRGFFLLYIDPDHKSIPMILINGNEYAGPGPFGKIILGLDKNKKPKVLYKSCFDLAELQDLNSDGTYEIVENPCYETVGTEFSIDTTIYPACPAYFLQLNNKYNGYLAPYCPYGILRLENKNTAPTIVSDSFLAEKYNLKNNGGWMGSRCSNKYYYLRRDSVSKLQLLPMAKAAAIWNSIK